VEGLTGPRFALRSASKLRTDDKVALSRATYTRLARFLATLLVLILLPAWTLNYWQGWLLWAVFSSGISFITIYFLRRDPALIERRSRAGPAAEKQVSQKIIQSFGIMLFSALIILPGIGHRHGWSRLPPLLVLSGDVLVIIGLYITFLVFQSNSYASATVELAPNQQVINTGPYRVVRHPMYTGGLLLLLGIPLALGSGWALLLWPPIAAVIIWRLIAEEKYLKANLPGYNDYCATTPYRLIPGVY
jgi:protein-S-isoprenylcysteine O-methyltransferase Ste14